MQIGPRIRVGGTVGKIGQNVKNAVTKGATDVGHAVGSVASNPLAQGGLAAFLAATGVGAPAAAAIMAGMKGGGALLAPGGNIGDGIGGAVKGAALGAGAAKAGDLVRGALSGGGGLSGVLGSAKSALTGGLKATGGFAGGAGAGSDVSGMSSILKLLGLAGTGIAGVQGYNDAKRAGAAQDAALGANTAIAQQLQAHGSDLLAGAAPIRKAAEAGMSARLAAGPAAPTPLPKFRSPFQFGPAIPAPPGRV